nr:hypothetical protein [Tanacetum cinerariifolium]
MILHMDWEITKDQKFVKDMTKTSHKLTQMVLNRGRLIMVLGSVPMSPFVEQTLSLLRMKQERDCELAKVIKQMIEDTEDQMREKFALWRCLSACDHCMHVFVVGSFVLLGLCFLVSCWCFVCVVYGCYLWFMDGMYIMNRRLLRFTIYHRSDVDPMWIRHRTAVDSSSTIISPLI